MRPALLVTGGAGFIGSQLVERLLERGRGVVVLDSFDPYYDPRIKRRNVERAARHPEYRLVEGDLLDPAAVGRAFGERPIEAVVHLAARAGVRPSIADPVTYAAVNVEGTTRLLEACRVHGVERFVFASSSSVYGNNAKVPFAEDDAVDHPISPYAATKRAGELVCYTYHQLFGIRVACLRLFTVYGPRQRPEMAISRFARELAAGRPVPLYGDGTASRDYTYVDDVLAGIERALERVAGYHVWNLGGSRPVTLDELVRRVAFALGVEPRIERRPAEPGDVARTCADVTRAARELDWRARVPLDAGLARFVAWLEQERAPSGASGPERSVR